MMRDRRLSIGGSEAATALGLNPYMSQHRLWLIKTGKAEPDDLSDNVAVELGTRLEDVIAEMYAARHNVKVHKINETQVHPKYSWMTANYDRRIVGVREGLECKTAGLVSGRPDPDWGDGGDEIPELYHLQVQHYLAFERFDLFQVPAIIAGKGYIEYTIFPDAELIGMIIEGEKAFWDMVESNTEPPVRSVEDARRRWPRSVAKEIQASPQIVAVDADLRIIEDKIKQLEGSKEAHQATVMAYMGEWDTLVHGTQRLRTWKNVDKTLLDQDKVKAELGPRLPEFQKLSTSRTFRRVELK